MNEPSLLTVDDVRERCRFSSRRPIYSAIERGELRAIRLGRQLRIEPEALEAWKAANVVVPRAPTRPSLGSHAPAEKGLRRLLQAVPDDVGWKDKELTGAMDDRPRPAGR